MELQEREVLRTKMEQRRKYATYGERKVIIIKGETKKTLKL